MTRILPPQPFLGVIAGRTLVLWAFVRGVAYAGSSALAMDGPASLAGPPIVPVAVAVVVLLVVRIELTRRSERLFLANLGFSFRRVAALVLVECALLESALRLGLG